MTSLEQLIEQLLVVEHRVLPDPTAAGAVYLCTCQLTPLATAPWFSLEDAALWHWNQIRRIPVELHRRTRDHVVHRTVESGTTYPWTAVGWTWERSEGAITVISPTGQQYQAEYAGNPREYDPSGVHVAAPMNILIAPSTPANQQRLAELLRKARSLQTRQSGLPENPSTPSGVFPPQ